MELSDYYNTLGLITIGDTEESVNKLLDALRDISKRFFGKGKTLEKNIIKLPETPELVLMPREAFYSEKNKVPFKESVGKISGEMIMAYPPGIPIIIAGERISQDIIDYIEELKEADLHIQGMEDPELETINVIEEEDAVYLYTEKMKNVLIGVQTNLGVNKTGTEFGPDDLIQAYPDTFDEMELISVERQKEDFNDKKLKFKNTVLDTCEKIAKRVNEAVIDGYRPILIGGDHSISLGSVSGVSLEKEIGVLWISAHGDMNTPESTLTGNIHGMPLALLQGLGDRELVNCFYEGAKLDSRNIVIFGAREIEVEERKIIEKTGVKIVYYDDILRKGIDNVLDEVKDYLKVDNLHISIDMNVFDPEIAPGVSVPVRNGMSYDEMFKSLKFAFKNYSVTSADITEFNPLNDINGKTAELVDDIVQYMMNPDY